MRGLLNDLAAIELQLAKIAEGPSLLPERGPGNWSPAVDIYETAKEFVLMAEAPGLKSEEIDIQVIDRQERPLTEDAYQQNREKVLTDWLTETRAAGIEANTIVTYDIWKAIVPTDPATLSQQPNIPQ